MSDDAIPFLIFILVAGVSLTSILVGARMRHKAFSAMANERELQYLKWELLDFPTNALDPFGNWDKAQEVYRGRVLNGVVMFFTIEQGTGRQSYRRTIVARRFDGAMPVSNLKFYPRVHIFEHGRWRIVTRVRPWLGGAEMTCGTIERAMDWLG